MNVKLMWISLKPAIVDYSKNKHILCPKIREFIDLSKDNNTQTHTSPIL